MNHIEKTKLRDEIEKLNNVHHSKIFDILSDNNVPYSKNKNGVFINLNCVDDNVLNILEKHIVYLHGQEKILYEVEKEKQKYEEEFFQDK